MPAARNPGPSAGPALTDRQEQVLLLIREGTTNRIGIARKIYGKGSMTRRALQPQEVHHLPG